MTSQPPVHTPGVSPSNLNSKASPLEFHSSKFSNNFLRTPITCVKSFCGSSTQDGFCFQHINLTDPRRVLGMGHGGAKVGGRPFGNTPFNTFSFSNHITVLLIPKISI